MFLYEKTKQNSKKLKYAENIIKTGYQKSKHVNKTKKIQVRLTHPARNAVSWKSEVINLKMITFWNSNHSDIYFVYNIIQYIEYFSSKQGLNLFYFNI